MTKAQPRRILLLGNPNTGKTTVFNYLTGFRARVGNYAGVTVEHKSGALKGTDGAVEVIDLPGTYSLAARSADELVAVEVLLGQRSDAARPDAVLIIVDASNLERNLFLASQVMECGLPCAVVLNMMDLVEKSGIKVNIESLTERLGVPVFPVAAAKETGFEPLLAWMKAPQLPAPAKAPCEFSANFQRASADLRTALLTAGAPAELLQPMLLQRVLLDEGDVARDRIVPHAGANGAALIDAARNALSEAEPRLLSLEAKTRYGAIRKLLDGVVQHPAEAPPSWSDALDRVLIHRVWGLVIFAFLMLIVFQAIYSWSAPFMDLIDAGFGAISGVVEGSLPEGPFRSFLVGGVISGVGGVIVFLPQILVLFFFISILEDCGYIARAAFLMDRLLSRVGLSGRSFIPMLSSFACAIPGIMATRTIENPKDRLTTILVAPLMSCSARLPVYTLLIGTFVPDQRVLFGLLGLQGLTLFAMYLVGVAVAIPVALLLKKTLLKGATPTFLMELPPYRMPIWRMVFHRLVDRGGAFLKRAGTIIFAVSVVIWALTYYPRPASVSEQVESKYASQIATLSTALADYHVKSGSFTSEQLLGIPDDVLSDASNHLGADTRAAATTARELAELEAHQAQETDGAYLRQSILGRMGVLIEPAVRPLGWDWKIGMAALASFPAREVVVSTLGIIYDLGGDTDEESTDLRSKLRDAERADGSKVFNLAVALSIMVFFALCAQCAATLAVIRRETNSWKWPAFAFAYMTGLAYLGALVTYQVAILFLPGGNS